LKRCRPVTRSSTRKSTTRYQYLPLNEEAREIRLLTLLPGTFSAEIRVLLHVDSFTEHHTPKYEALSYAWGSIEDSATIKVGTSGEDSLAVTQDLAIALQHLRLSDKSRIFWIDAICVDQQNLQERGHQVRRMSDIYRKADRVVVWLGPENDQSGLALKLLQDLNSKIVVDWGVYTCKPAWNDPFEEHWADVNADPPYEDGEWYALRALLDRSWFQRLWIWQEIRLANPKTTTVMCGFDAIIWQHFKDALFCLYLKPIHVRTFGVFERAIKITDNGFKPQLQQLAYETAGAKCSDYRDRIYALLSIVNDYHGKLNIIPNYSKTLRQVYKDATVSILAHSAYSNILAFCELATGGTDMPSWVPNWTLRKESEPFQYQLANGSTSSNILYLGDGVLQATGVLLGKVAEVEAIPLMIRLKDTIPVVRKLVPFDAADTVYLGGSSMLDACCRTLCGNELSDYCLPIDTNFATFHEGKKALQAALFQILITWKKDCLGSRFGSL
jgi:hypothetical protein